MARVNGPLVDAEAEDSDSHLSVWHWYSISDSEGVRDRGVSGEGGDPASQPAAALRVVQGGNQQFSDLER